MNINKKSITRFLKYSTVGVGTFLFDLVLLFIFVSMLGVNYIIATGLAFLIAVTLNYLLSRKFVFNKTETLYLKGYIQFILVASIGVTLTIAGMYALVTLIGVYYLLARCLISSLVGIGNYLFNLYCNFKVVGEH